MHYDLFVLAIFPALIAAAAVYDISSLMIPNRLIILLVIGFCAAALLTGLSPARILQHGLCASAVLILSFALFAKGWIGGGDAKLLSASALWLGWETLAPLLMHTAIAGGVLALVILAFRAMPISLAGWPHCLERLHDKASGIPYGVAIGVASVMIYWQSFWMRSYI